MSVLVLGALLASLDGGAPALEGTWELDPARSGDLGPLLDRIGVNFIARAAARGARPTHVISLSPGRATIEVRGLGGRRSTFVLDGRTPVDDEVVGKPLRLTAAWDGDVLVSTGTVSVGERALPVETRRWVHADGSMRFTIKLSGPGEAPVMVERVFTRQPSR